MTTEALIVNPHIGLDTPLRLERAVELAFPEGGMTVSGLRREAAKGRLTIEEIAGKHFTTLRSIDEMRQKCRATAKESASGSNPRSEAKMENSSIAPHGSSGTDRVKCARAALEKTAKVLSARSPNTALPDSKFRESVDVTPLKSRSSTC
jgi:hypothetical protein